MEYLKEHNGVHSSELLSSLQIENYASVHVLNILYS